MTDTPEADRPTPTVQMVAITNHNDFLIRDMFNGIPVNFPIGVPVDVSPEIALHCFGWPGELHDRALHMAKRYGWSGRDYLKPEGLGDGPPRYEVLASKIEIRPIYYDLVRRNPNDPIPLDTGDEADDRPDPRAEADTSTKVGKHKRRAKARTDRHRTGGREAVKLGSR
jgi:hypothetical protein